MKRLLIATTFLIAALSVDACARRGADPGPPAAVPAPTATNDVPLPTAPPLSGGLPTSDVLPGILPRAGGFAAPPAAACQSFTLTAALFDENSPALRPGSGYELTSVAQQIEAEGGTVTIIGYTDARPAAFPGGNQALSESRARSVRDALAIRGVKNIADVEGRGDREPVDLGTTDAAYHRNRRVEVTVHCDKPETVAVQ